MREAGAGCRAAGRKDGEGRIDSNPNNNKAFKGRARPALQLFLGGFWVKGSSWSLTSGVETPGVGAPGERARRPTSGVRHDVCGDADEGGLSV